MPRGLGLPLDNLRRNAGRLVTHMDLHATLLGVARLEGTHRKHYNYRRPPPPPPGAVGIDLIWDELPRTRSCVEAGIPDAWCNCFQPADEKNGDARDRVDSWDGGRPAMVDDAGEKRRLSRRGWDPPPEEMR